MIRNFTCRIVYLCCRTVCLVQQIDHSCAGSLKSFDQLQQLRFDILLIIRLQKCDLRIAVSDLRFERLSSLLNLCLCRQQLLRCFF